MENSWRGGEVTLNPRHDQLPGTGEEQQQQADSRVNLMEHKQFKVNFKGNSGRYKNGKVWKGIEKFD